MRKTCMVAGLVGIAVAAALLVLQPSRSTARNDTKESGKSPTAALLPISQVVLFSSGVGYFQREGTIEGTQRIDLSFATQDVNDLIKSMTLRDLDGGRTQGPGALRGEGGPGRTRLLPLPERRRDRQSALPAEPRAQRAARAAR